MSVTRAILTNLFWFVPFVLLAAPALDGLLIAYAAVCLVGAVISAAAADPVSADNRDGTDNSSQAIIGVAMLLAQLIGAADVGRWHLSAGIPDTWRGVALALLATAYVLRVASIRNNRFFTGPVVIQAERGHHVIDHGLYAGVRHPGNLTLLVIALALPIALGSWLAVGWGVVAFAGIVRRTYVEDAFLHERLDGYRDYARQVRFRLVPGLY